MARARRLAIAKASSASLGRFLLGQSDVIFMLCGGPAVWYVSHRRQRAQISQQAGPVVQGSQARAVHQLRQVFTALLLGTELLARKAAAGKTGELGKLALRLNRIVCDGVVALSVLGEPDPAALLDEHGAPYGHDLGRNGLEM